MNKRKRAKLETEKQREEYLSLRKKNHESMLHYLPEGEKKENLWKLVEEISVARPLSVEEKQQVKEKNRCFKEEFQEKVGIHNPTDLKILQLATALQLMKTVLVGVVNGKIGFLESFDPNTRLHHNDISIKKEERLAKDAFRTKYQEKENGSWLQTLYSSAPYDSIKGSSALGLSLNGKNHREKTLGHDPVLGLLFGTMNNLTSTVTLSDFSTYRVAQNPQRFTGETMDLFQLFSESLDCIRREQMNLPAAFATQLIHIQSDKYTKMGLPVPFLSSIAPDFSSQLYQKHYDTLCFSRDLKCVAGSVAVSSMIDLLIILLHEAYRGEEEAALYQVRTKKILMVSNGIASASSFTVAMLTKNPQNLDHGGLFHTCCRVARDSAFFMEEKQRYITNEIQKEVEQSIKESADMLQQKHEILAHLQISS